MTRAIYLVAHADPEVDPMRMSTAVHQQEPIRTDPDRLLRATAVVFLAALLLHGADHLRRGFDVLTPEVFWAGNFQLVTALITVFLVFRRHRWAPLAAIAIGLPSAVGFVASHLLPHWSSFSDAFPGGDVDAWSWAAALFEIAADLAFAAAGWNVLRNGGWEAVTASPDSWDKGPALG